MLSRQHQKNTLLTVVIKCGAITFLLLLSILVIACSGNGSSQLDPGTPVVTVTINLGQVIGSPTPTRNDYYCGGWATDTSPPFSSTSIVSVFGKYTHIDVDGNPEGVAGASATATIKWPDGTTDILNAKTTSDGLAVFPVAIKPSAINKLVTIMITFTPTSADVKPCTIPSAAYFTAILVSPTPTKTAVPSPTPTGSPTPGGTVTPTGTPASTPSPTPTKPGH